MQPNSITLGPVTDDLKDAALRDGWFENYEENWLLGFGKEEIGAIRALENFKILESRDKAEKNFGLFGIYMNDDPIGYTTLEYLGDDSKTTKIYIFLTPLFRGEGLGQQALYHILDVIFSGKVHRVEAEVLSTNKHAISFLRTFGFTQEGVKRDAYWMGINSFNLVLLRLLRPEWNKRIKKVD